MSNLANVNYVEGIFIYYITFGHVDPEEGEVSMVGWVWEKFQTLNSHPISAPILMLTKGLDGFMIYYDTSYVGLDYVICLDHCDSSRQLKVHEWNYPNQDLELAVIVFVLKFGVTNFIGCILIYLPTTKDCNIC